MKIIQVTDMHVVPSGERIHGLQPIIELNACIDDINANHSDADLCVFTGDLANHGKTESYQALRESLSRLSLPYRLIMGNHDHRERLRKTFPETPCDENGFIQYVERRDKGDLFFLDTVWDGYEPGRYCETRQAWLRARFEESGTRPVYMFQHHPPEMGVGHLDNLNMIDDIRLKDSDAMYDIIKDFNVRHIFSGHVHRTVSGSWHGIPYSTIRGTNHATSSNWAGIEATVRNEPPQYAVIIIEDNTLVHVHEYLDTHDMARRVQEFTIQP